MTNDELATDAAQSEVDLRSRIAIVEGMLSAEKVCVKRLEHEGAAKAKKWQTFLIECRKAHQVAIVS